MKAWLTSSRQCYVQRRERSGERTTDMIGESGADLAWDETLQRFSGARVWWVATSHPQRGPHTVPVWGVVVEGTPYIYGETSSRRHRDLADDARAVVHLEDGEDVLILRGQFRDAGLPTDYPAVIEAYRAKYTEPDDADSLPDVVTGGQLLRFEPDSALAWSRATDYQPVRLTPPA